MRRVPMTHILLSLALSLLFGCAARSVSNKQNVPTPPAPANNYLQYSTNAVQRLQIWYTPSTGLYQSTGWWNSANAITVLVDYARVSKSKQYTSVFANTFTAAQKTNPAFLNNFYDDEGWWALAWIDAYDLTRNRKYLSMAESIFSDMAASWDDTCGGGIWWSKDRKYKNAIANELFLSVAAHLANRTSGAVRGRYLNWSKKEWYWFRASGMINSQNLINDGLGKSEGQTTGVGCTNNGRTTWSYNQGVILGGLAELSVTSPDPSLIEAAQKIARAATTLLVDSKGVLHDPCEPHCGADGVQFKGIFVRNLDLLNGAQPRAAYRDFVFANADAIWIAAQGPNYQLGEVWSGPFIVGNAGSQSSALDAIVAAASMQMSHLPESK
jgi:predicted alpha-1,6-mannanase (GH76 family)